MQRQQVSAFIQFNDESGSTFNYNTIVGFSIDSNELSIDLYIASGGSSLRAVNIYYADAKSAGQDFNALKSIFAVTKAVELQSFVEARREATRVAAEAEQNAEEPQSVNGQSGPTLRLTSDADVQETEDDNA